MTSLLRSNPAGADAKTKFVPIKSFTYHNNDYNGTGEGHTVLIPFTYKNGVLDVSTTVGGFTPSDGQGDDQGYSWRMVRVLGGTGLVNTLGPNFITWFSEYWNGGGLINFTIVTAPIMTKVQMSVPLNDSILNSQYAVIGDLEEAPSSDEFITGSEATNYDTVYVFKTPLVISYQYTGTNTVYYASFYTQFTNPS